MPQTDSFIAPLFDFVEEKEAFIYKHRNWEVCFGGYGITIGRTSSSILRNVRILQQTTNILQSL